MSGMRNHKATGLPQLGADLIAEVRLRRYCGEPLKSIERAMGRPVRYYAYGGKTRAELIAADPTYYERHKAARNRSFRRGDTPEFRALRAERHRLYYAARQRVKALQKNWELTPGQYDAMLDAQGGVCAICSGENTRKDHRHLAVDHDHKTNSRRGLLCDRCNLALGWFWDDPDVLGIARAYLEAYV